AAGGQPEPVAVTAPAAAARQGPVGGQLEDAGPAGEPAPPEVGRRGFVAYASERRGHSLRLHGAVPPPLPTTRARVSMVAGRPPSLSRNSVYVGGSATLYGPCGRARSRSPRSAAAGAPGDPAA